MFVEVYRLQRKGIAVFNRYAKGEPTTLKPTQKTNKGFCVGEVG